MNPLTQVILSGSVVCVIAAVIYVMVKEKKNRLKQCPTGLIKNACGKCIKPCPYGQAPCGCDGKCFVTATFKCTGRGKNVKVCPNAQACDSECCADTQRCIDGKCIDCAAEATVCLGKCCNKNEKCSNSGCCPDSNVCEDKTCCKNGPCCGKKCCGLDQICCDGVCKTRCGKDNNCDSACDVDKICFENKFKKDTSSDTTTSWSCANKHCTWSDVKITPSNLEVEVESARDIKSCNAKATEGGGTPVVTHLGADGVPIGPYSKTETTTDTTNTKDCGVIRPRACDPHRPVYPPCGAVDCEYKFGNDEFVTKVSFDGTRCTGTYDCSTYLKSSSPTCPLGINPDNTPNSRCCMLPEKNPGDGKRFTGQVCGPNEFCDVQRDAKTRELKSSCMSTSECNKLHVKSYFNNAKKACVPCKKCTWPTNVTSKMDPNAAPDPNMNTKTPKLTSAIKTPCTATQDTQCFTQFTWGSTCPDLTNSCDGGQGQLVSKNTGIGDGPNFSIGGDAGHCNLMAINPFDSDFCTGNCQKPICAK